MGHEAWERRKAMVAEQIVRRGVADEAVLTAMRTVPRHLFVPDALKAQAYEDRPLPVHDRGGAGPVQTISQPYMVAAMSEALRVKAGDRVLEVGAGTGYQAAVLAELASEVFAVELLPDLAEQATQRLAALHYHNVTVRQSDGALGWPEAAPFDGILVACGAKEVPPALFEQLRPGGRLVIPVGPAGDVMQLEVWQKDAEGALERETLMPVRFVPLVAGDE